MFTANLRVLQVGLAAIFFSAHGSQAACSPADLQGMAVPAASTVDRTVTVVPGMKAVNVKFGETVKFVMPGGQETSWRFIGTEEKLPLADVLASGSAAKASTGLEGRDLHITVAQAGNPMKYRCANK